MSVQIQMILIVQKIVQILLITKLHHHLNIEGIYDSSINIYNIFSNRIKRINNKMKPCLVHKTSTSDEELQSNEINPSIQTGRSNEQPTHGILKVPSGETFSFE
jgi:hypothetical protein